MTRRKKEVNSLREVGNPSPPTVGPFDGRTAGKEGDHPWGHRKVVPETVSGTM